MLHNFNEFKESPGAYVLGRANINISLIESWQQLRLLACQNYEDYIGELIKSYDNASSGERVLVQALLYALDFARAADQLNPNFFQSVHRCSGEHRAALNYLLSIENFHHAQ